MNQMPTLADRQSCTGCGACAAACPVQCMEMRSDAAGFLYPEIISPEKCLHCDRCAHSCPVITPLSVEEGQVTAAYAAYARDEGLRLESSSGGIFSELADWVVRNGGVVYGAAYAHDFSVKHMAVDSTADISYLRGGEIRPEPVGKYLC